jgi:hypothetical protein
MTVFMEIFSLHNNKDVSTSCNTSLSASSIVVMVKEAASGNYSTEK